MVGRPFVKGERRTGRAKGTPNKATQTIKELMELEEDGVPGPIALWRAGKKAIEKGYSSQKAVEMGDETIIVDEPDAGLVSAGLSAMGKALAFAYPTLKAIEHSGAVKAPPAVNIILAPDPK